MVEYPSLYWSINDDLAGPPSTFEPVDHPAVSYVTIADERGRLMGLAVVSAHTSYTWEVHNLVFPSVGWKTRLKIGQEFFEWLWKAGCRRVIGKVLESNRYALAFNAKLGMERIGVNRAAFMKNGQLQNEVWFGISPKNPSWT